MAYNKLIDLSLLDRAIEKIKALIPKSATNTPLMDGTAAIGSSAKYAKEDHVHPRDTTVESITTISNVITAGSGFTITNATYKQWGKVAQLYFQASKTAAQTSEASMTVGTVVSGKRPAVLVGMICTDTAIKYAYVAAGGTVSARGTWAAGVTKTFVATYILP